MSQIYVYQADLWCETCARSIMGDREESADSDYHPQWVDETTLSFDSPRHCAGCGDFLDVPLSSAGVGYVSNALEDYMERGHGDPYYLDLWAAHLVEHDLGDSRTDAVVSRYMSRRNGDSSSRDDYHSWSLSRVIREIMFRVSSVVEIVDPNTGDQRAAQRSDMDNLTALVRFDGRTFAPDDVLQWSLTLVSDSSLVVLYDARRARYKAALSEIDRVSGEIRRSGEPGFSNPRARADQKNEMGRAILIAWLNLSDRQIAGA